jgi:DNA-binding NtrC family response regulator
MAAAFRQPALEFIRVSGARLLARPARETSAVELVQEFTDLLRICHDADDDRAGLVRICEVMRDRLGASGVAILGAPGANESPVLGVAGHPGVTRSALALRSLGTNAALPVGADPAALDAAAPIGHGGRAIGVVVARWLPGALVDPARTLTLLKATAAAAWPIARAAADRASTPPAVAGRPELELLGISAAIEQVRQAVLRAAPAPFAVLIEGESGSGKELVARAIHRCGPRRERRFCALNCAALTDDLFEAELFGHARGAFTGAVGERIGLFEEADAGTLFLDEVGELSPRAQAKLLRALQQGEIRRVGENQPRHVDVRVISATNRPLHDEAAAGRFRQDLLYRLNVLRIVVPPLRERIEDVPILVAHFWHEATARTGSGATLEPATVAALAGHTWPGNIRELQNVLAALAVRAPRRGRVGPSSLPLPFGAGPACRPDTLDAARRAFERQFVRSTLARVGGHRGRAAAELGISRQGLAKLLARLQIDAEGGQNASAEAPPRLVKIAGVS